ncbi:uncharacterized protein EI97DRAFT_372926, partial [Westerdykella ornata]
ISLAHFCELHGPTSIICTQATTSPCSTCNPCVTPPSEEAPISSLPYNNSVYDHPALSLPGRLASPFDTPPTSPRSPSHNPYFPTLSSDRASSASRRPSSTLDADPDVCENCSIVIPKKYSDKLTTSAPASPSKDRRGAKIPNPVLRTVQKFPVRGCPADTFGGSPDYSDVSDNEQSRSFDSSQSYPDSIPGSPVFAASGMHTHTLNYISTSQPQSPALYSLLRRICIRALSCEALPGGRSAGPMMFGDPVAGYTIAYIFRLQDPRSRGAKRTYALLAMTGTHWRASRVMVKVTELFEIIANRIVKLAEDVLAKEKEAAPSSLNLSSLPSVTSSMSTSAGSTSPQKSRFPPSMTSSPATATTRSITPVSSFLSAKKVDPDGYPRLSRDVMRPKTLVEIVGNENFFVELHGWFCRLLQCLIKEFGC